MSRTRRNFGPKYRARFISPWQVDSWSHETVGCVFAFKGGDICISGKEWYNDPVCHPLGKRRLKRQASHARRDAGKNFLSRELAEG